MKNIQNKKNCIQSIQSVKKRIKTTNFERKQKNIWKNIKYVNVRASAANAWTLIILDIRGGDPQTDPENLKGFIYLNFVECD